MANIGNYDALILVYADDLCISTSDINVFNGLNDHLHAVLQQMQLDLNTSKSHI